MAKKFYAIKEGFDFTTNTKVENKIVTTWAECLQYVKGVKGAKYKSFESIEEANGYISESSKLLKKGIDKYPEDCLHVYVDGSYDINSQKYSYGVVAVKDNVVEYIESEAAKDSSQRNIRQIAGELQGAIRGVEYAISKNYEKIVIFHDYEGIAHHATGLWERKEESSINYHNKMKELMALGVEVIFVKVDSHTGDFFNELADEKCKEALNIQSEGIVSKWLRNNQLLVKNEKIKKQILSIAPQSSENIIINNNLNEKSNIKSDKYQDILAEYLKSRSKGITYIKNLNEKEKIDFIDYIITKYNQ